MEAGCMICISMCPISCLSDHEWGMRLVEPVMSVASEFAHLLAPPGAYQPGVKKAGFLYINMQTRGLTSCCSHTHIVVVLYSNMVQHRFCIVCLVRMLSLCLSIYIYIERDHPCFRETRRGRQHRRWQRQQPQQRWYQVLLRAMA